MKSVWALIGIGPVLGLGLGLISRTWAADATPPAVALPLPPELTVTACAQPPVIDGVLTDACWQTAAVITNLQVLFQTPARGAAQKAWVTFDAQWLYVAVDLAHPNPKEIKPKNLAHDSAVQQDDSVELFLDPGTEGALYLHFKLNAANARGEQRVTAKSGTEVAWDIPWRSATRLTATGWTAEIAVPLAILASYGDLEKTRMNLCVNQFEPLIDPQGVKVGDKRTWLGWAALRGSFHEPEHFGFLRGLKPGKLSLPFLPGFKAVTAGKYSLAQGQYSYPVSLEIRNFSSQTGAVQVTVRDQPLAGKAAEISQTVNLTDDKWQRLELAVPVAALTDRAVQVLIKDPVTGEILQSEPVADTSAFNLMSAFPDRNYYTTEADALVTCALGLPAEDLQAMIVVARATNNAVLATTSEARPETRVAVPLAKLAVGTHALSVELARRGGETVCRQNVELIKREPKPGLEWKVDRVNRVLLDNGRPYFPFGPVFAHTNEACFKEIGEAGFNSIMYWWFHSDPTNARAQIDLAAKYNLKMVVPTEIYGQDILTGIKGVLVTGEGEYMIKKYFQRAPGDDRKISQLTQKEKSKIFADAYAANLDRMLLGVRNIKDAPNLLGYNTFDEPFGPQFFDQWVQGLDLYQKTGELDGYHPTFALAGPPEFDFCDIFGGDPYWVPASPNATPNYVGWYFHQFDKRAVALHKMVWMVPMGEFWSGCHKRAVLPKEQYVQTYLLLIHGAKGLFYFVYPFVHQGSFDALAGLAKQMQTLGPIAVAPDIRQTVTYQPGELDLENKKYPDVQVCLRRNPAGGTVLLAANSRFYPVDVNYRISLLGRKGKVRRLFADDTYRVKDGAFEDRLEGYGVRAYTLTETADGREPVTVAVIMTAHPEQSVEEIAIPRTGRPGKKNLAPNPSLEESSLPGIPDYYWPYNMSGPRIGQAGSQNGLDPVNPWHGKVSMKLSTVGFMAGYLAPKVEKPTEFVYSAYLRASRDGVKVKFMGKGFGNKEFTLTKEWQRYSETGIIQPKTSYYDDYNLMGIRGSRGDTIWVDGIQMEAGTEPTAFEP